MPSEDDWRGSAPSAAVIAILDRFDARIDSLARGHDVAADRRDVSAVDMPELLRHSTRRFLQLASRAIRENRTFTADELRPIREGAVHAAEDGVSLAALLRNWFRFGRTMFDECRVAAAGERAAGMVEIAAAVLRLQETVTRAVVDAYESERSALDGGEKPSKELVARILLAGQDADPATRWCGIELADEYAVVALFYEGAQPDPAVRWSVEARIARVIDRCGTPPVLAVLETGGGMLLVPGKADGGADWNERVSGIVDSIAAVVGGAVTAAVAEPAGRARLRESSALATELLLLARRLGQRPGLYRLEDLALPFQLSRPTAGQRYLGDRLLPLDPYPELVETLDAFLHHDLDRGRTARVLDVHPNTVNNRLGRIRELVGIDPVSYDGIMALGSALDARRAQGWTPGAAP